MPMMRSTRARLTAVALLFLVLAAGFGLGAAWVRYSEAGIAGEAGQSRRGGGERTDRVSRDAPDRSRRPPLLVEQVGLSEEQKEKVDSIVSQQRRRMRELQEEFDAAYMPRYRSLIEETRESIRGILTTGQRTAYDSILAGFERRREENRREHPDSNPRG